LTFFNSSAIQRNFFGKNFFSCQIILSVLEDVVRVPVSEFAALIPNYSLCLEDVVRVPVSEFTGLTQSIQSMNNKLDSLTPSLLPVRTVLSPAATSGSSQPMNGGVPGGPLSAATAGYSRAELPELPPRIPERKTPGQPLPGTRDRPPDPGIGSAHTSDKDSLLDDTKTLAPVVSSVVVTASMSSTVSSIVTTSAVKSRGGPVIDGEVKKQVLNVTEAASFSTPSGGIGKGGKREEEGKMEEELTSRLEISNEEADQQAKVIFHREKIQKTKSQELRDFTQEFVATSTIDFDPMSFQDHQSARNKNDTLRRGLLQETVGTPATVNQLGTPATLKQLGTTVTSKLSGTPFVPKLLGAPVAQSQSVTPAVPVPVSQPSVKTSAAPVPVISTVEKKAHASKDDLHHSPVEKNREGAVHREKIVPSESFMTALQQSGSESSQDEPPPPPEVAKRGKADHQPPADDSTAVPVENRGSSTLSASPGGPVLSSGGPVLNSGGPVRTQPGSVGLSSSSGPVRQDLHTTAGAGTSSDLLEWAKGILAAYPGLKVRLVMVRTSLNRLMLATKCYLLILSTYRYR
jgi:hypothetical protein